MILADRPGIRRESGQTTSLPPGWAVAPLEDVVDILDYLRVPVNRDERAKRFGTVPYYGATGQAGWIDDYIFNEELVLLGEDGAPFLEGDRTKAYMIRGPSWVNNHAHVLRGRPGIANAYLLHQLNQIDYRAFVSGTTRLKLPQGPMRQIPLVIAPHSEQLRIVAEIETQLTRLDAAVAALERARANLKRYRNSVYRSAVCGQLRLQSVEENSATEPQSALLASILAERRQASRRRKYKEPELRLMAQSPDPVGNWVWATLQQLTAPDDGLITGPFGTLISKADFRSNGVPIAGIANIQEAGFQSRASDFLSEGKAKQLSRYALKAGDLVVSRSGTVGEICVVPQGGDGYVMSTNLMRLRLISDQIDPRWLVLNFRGSLVIQQQLQRMLSGSTRPFLNLEILSQLLVPLPTLSIQQEVISEVERRLSVVDEIENAIITDLNRAQRLRQAILRKAFSGELVPQDPDDEPAEALLGRIREERAMATAKRPKTSARSKKSDQYALW